MDELGDDEPRARFVYDNRCAIRRARWATTSHAAESGAGGMCDA